MNLAKKKSLAAKALKVGESRIIFNTEHLAEIKEAITKQDIKDLFNSKAILIRDIRGRKKIEGRKTRRRMGSIRNRVIDKKRKYIYLTRKLRSYVASLKDGKKISQEQYTKIRKQIRAGIFKSKNHMKEVVSTK